MKRIFTLCMGLVLTAVGTWAQNEPKSILLTPQEKELVQQNNDFAFRLFRKARTSESQLLSPLSITYALGMMNNGAQGQTQKEINEVLGVNADLNVNPNEGAEVLNQLCGKLLKESGTLDKETKVNIANTVYVNKDFGVHLKKNFTEKAAEYYDATPEERSFSDGQTLDVINKWGSDHTEGMIEQVLSPDEFDPSAITYLLNALYFKGTWQQKFDKSKTTPGLFNNDENQMIVYMAMQGQFRYFQNKTYQSIVLPYGNGAYQMTVFLPNKNKQIDDVLNELNGKNWNADAYEDYNVFLIFPKFETETDIHLEDIMMQLGMPNAFGGEGFNELCYSDDDESQSINVQIDLMKQVAKIKLDEEGTEAAAVTVVGTKNGEMKTAYIEANHPFLYIISEQSTGAIFFMGQYMGETVDNPRGSISLTKEEKELVQQNNDFAFNLFRTARTGDSQMLSPLSITYALGMLNNGATGQTQEEINKALGFGEAGAEAINAFCRKMLDEAPKLDKTTKVGIANTIYVNEGQNIQLKPAFVETAQQYYDATPEVRDFHDGQTMDVINQWANDHTNGMIPKILNEQTFNPDYASYLLNALYFKGTWMEKFKPENTKDELFNGKEMVPMMHIDHGFQYKENDLYQAVQLPYGNGAYKMTVFLPREGKYISDVLEKLDGKSWTDYYRPYLVDLKLPRFETDTDQDLVKVMKALGVNKAFEVMAEFPNFCNLATYIDMMRQVSKIKVNEEGTEAAAVTSIGDAVSSMPQEAQFYANRPFLYIISEQSTGAIFFIGQYTGLSGEARETDGISDAPRLNDKEEMINDKYYNLKGQRLSAPPAKGLYIQNGKKVKR